MINSVISCRCYWDGRLLELGVYCVRELMIGLIVPHGRCSRTNRFCWSYFWAVCNIPELAENKVHTGFQFTSEIDTYMDIFHSLSVEVWEMVEDVRMHVIKAGDYASRKTGTAQQEISVLRWSQCWTTDTATARLDKLNIDGSSFIIRKKILHQISHLVICIGKSRKCNKILHQSTKVSLVDAQCAKTWLN